MDTEAYLRRHGWQGTGHSLHPTKSSALKRPLLVSKKIDVLGLGLNKNDAISDQWWLRAFDSSLKDFGTGKQSILSDVATHGVKRGGLYGRFVKGEGVPGTIGQREPGAETAGNGVKDEASVVATTVTVSLAKQTARDSSDSTSSSSSDESDSASSTNSDSEIDSGTTPPSSTSSKRKATFKDNHRAKKVKVEESDTSASDSSEDDDNTMDGTAPPPTKSKSYKAAKYERGAEKRAAKREKRAAAKGRLNAAKGLPENAGGMSQEQKTKAERKEEQKKARRIASRKRREEKLAKRNELKAVRAAKIAAQQAQAVAEGRGVTTQSGGDIAGSSDFVSLGAEKLLPGEKTTKQLKREAREAAKVEKAAKKAAKAKAKPAPVPTGPTELERAAQLGIDLSTFRALPVTDYELQQKMMKQLNSLDTDKRARYASRAAAKDQSLTVYFMARTVKNHAAANKPLPESATSIPAASAAQSNLAFVIDTTGTSDPSLAEKSVLNGGNAMPATRILEIVDPKMWKGKPAGKLTPEVRKMRLQWARARKTARLERRAVEKRVLKVEAEKRRERKVKEKEAAAAAAAPVAVAVAA